MSKGQGLMKTAGDWLHSSLKLVFCRRAGLGIFNDSSEDVHLATSYSPRVAEILYKASHSAATQAAAVSNTGPDAGDSVVKAIRFVGEK